jgi:hypothetical protein
MLSPLGIRAARTRSSFYADDATLFLNFVKEEMTVIQRILRTFGFISGLKANLHKCVVYPIQYNNIEIEEVLNEFGG